MKNNIQPLRDNILIAPEKEEKNKTESGIFLPESTSEEKPQIGKVVAVGVGEDINVKKNQKVIYNKYSGTEVEIDDKEYLIVKSEDVLAVIE